MRTLYLLITVCLLIGCGTDKGTTAKEISDPGQAETLANNLEEKPKNGLVNQKENATLVQEVIEKKKKAEEVKQVDKEKSKLKDLNCDEIISHLKALVALVKSNKNDQASIQKWLTLNNDVNIRLCKEKDQNFTTKYEKVRSEYDSIFEELSIEDSEY